MPPSPSSAPGSAAAAVLGDLKGGEGLSHLEPRVKGQGEEEIVEHLVEELKAEGESDPQVSEPRGWSLGCLGGGDWAGAMLLWPRTSSSFCKAETGHSFRTFCVT